MTRHLIIILTTAASFFIPAMERVAESDSMLQVCISMRITPSNAMLAMPVNLTLSTMDGSGMYVNIDEEHTLSETNLQLLMKIITL